MSIDAISQSARRVRPVTAINRPKRRPLSPLRKLVPLPLRLLRRLYQELGPTRPRPAAALIDLESLASTDVWFYDHFVKVPKIIADFLGRAIVLENSVVLDFGCGEGLMAKGLARFGCDVHGVDLEPMFSNLEERFRRMFGEYNPFPPVTLQVAQAGSPLPYPDGSFDGVYAWSVFEHVADVPFAMREIRRVLRPGGAFFLQIFPLFFSPQGGHLWNVLDEPWIHLKLGRQELLDRIASEPMDVAPDRARHDASQGATADDYRAGVISCQDSLNRVTVAELTNHLRQAGFEVLRCLTKEDRTHEIPANLLTIYPREDLVTDQVVMLMRAKG